MSRSRIRRFAVLTIVAAAGALAFAGPYGSDSGVDYFNGGVAIPDAAGSAALEPGRDGAPVDGRVRAVIASAHLASSIGACAKITNGQLRLADAAGCLPSEVALSLSAGDVTPVDVSRVLTLPEEGGPYGGIFGGLLCPANRTLVSSGFQVMRGDVEIRESYVGPGFGLPRVAIAFAASDDGAPLPAGTDVVRIWATCM